MLKRLKTNLFGDRPSPNLYFEKTKLFDFRNEDKLTEWNEREEWYKCASSHAYGVYDESDKAEESDKSDEGDDNSIFTEPKENNNTSIFTKPNENDERFELYNLTTLQALLLRNYLHF